MNRVERDRKDVELVQAVALAAARGERVELERARDALLEHMRKTRLEVREDIAEYVLRVGGQQPPSLRTFADRLAEGIRHR